MSETFHTRLATIIGSLIIDSLTIHLIAQEAIVAHNRGRNQARVRLEVDPNKDGLRRRHNEAENRAQTNGTILGTNHVLLRKHLVSAEVAALAQSPITAHLNPIHDLVRVVEVAVDRHTRAKAHIRRDRVLIQTDLILLRNEVVVQNEAKTPKQLPVVLVRTKKRQNLLFQRSVLEEAVKLFQVVVYLI